jgi:hypothetical protein
MFEQTFANSQVMGPLSLGEIRHTPAQTIAFGRQSKPR